MPDFNFDLFTKPDQYEETLLRDRKAYVEYWKPKEKAEFIRDIIALANTARMMGQPAYLIMGVHDAADGTLNDIRGIGEMLDRQIRQGRTELQARETLRQEMMGIVRRYVTPVLSPEIPPFDKINENVVGYVLIPPLTGEPFQVSREFRDGGQTYLHPGQCWLRYGESKGEVKPKELAPDDDKLRYCYAEVPYVLPSMWQDYFEQVQFEIQRLWNKAGPLSEAAYQELRDSKGVPIRQIADEFLEENDARLLILQGAAGCGKSLFLQRLALSLVKEGAQDVEAAKRLEQFRPPGGFIPVLFSLRDLTRSARADSARFTEELCKLLHVLWVNNKHGQRPKNPEKLFANPNLHWLILLDGLDELGQYDHRREFLNVLLAFMRAYPRLRIVLTTRPVIALEGVEHSRWVEIAPLAETQIESFFSAYRTDRNDAEIHVFVQQCQEWEDAWKLLSVPAYLNAAVTSLDIPRIITDAPEQEAGSNETTTLPEEIVSQPDEPVESSLLLPDRIDTSSLEVDKPIIQEDTQRLEDSKEEVIVTLPRLLDRVYGKFWERERQRDRFAGIDDLRCRTYKLAATSMTTCPARVERERAKKLLQARGLQWTLEMGVLADNEYDHVFFCTPSTQVYSAAKKLQGDIEGGFWDSIRRYTRCWQEPYRVDIESFFEDLTGNPLSTLLQTQGGSNG